MQMVCFTLICRCVNRWFRGSRWQLWQTLERLGWQSISLQNELYYIRPFLSMPFFFEVFLHISMGQDRWRSYPASLVWETKGVRWPGPIERRGPQNWVLTRLHVSRAALADDVLYSWTKAVSGAVIVDRQRVIFSVMEDMRGRLAASHFRLILWAAAEFLWVLTSYNLTS